MRVKKYHAKNMAEAMKMVKADLGANAIILHSRDTGKGLWGIFSGRGVEVTAAVDAKDTRTASAINASLPPKKSELPSLTQPQRNGNKIDFRVDDSPKSGLDNPLLALSKQLAEERKPPQSLVKPAPELKTPTPLKPIEQSTPPLQKDPAPLENRLIQLESQLTKLTRLIENIAPSLASGDVPSVPTRTREVYNHLLEQDVDEHLALSIATHIAETTDEKDDVWTALKQYLISQIKVAQASVLDFQAKSPKIILLIGPTGVGKTTTLAKISALYRYSMEGKQRPKLVFITADLYRLAAVEQLQKYTEILGANLEVTYSPEEVRDAIHKHKDAQLILFDTAGTCQRNLPQMSTLSSICEAAQPTEVHLVLSATTKYSDMVDIVEHFKEVKPDRLIFTKIDESTTYGPILNTLIKFKIPISYLTIGQNVPEDIEQARADRVAKLLLLKPTVNRSIEHAAQGPETPAENAIENPNEIKSPQQDNLGKQDRDNEASYS